MSALPVQCACGRSQVFGLTTDGKCQCALCGAEYKTAILSPEVTALVTAARALLVELHDRHDHPHDPDMCDLIESHEIEDLAAALAPFAHIKEPAHAGKTDEWRAG